MAWKATAKQLAALNTIRAGEKGTKGAWNRHWKSRPPIPETDDVWFATTKIADVVANDDDRQLQLRMTTVAPDADRDVILPRGLDLARFRESPTILYGHDWGGVLENGIITVVGKAMNLDINDTHIDAIVKVAPTNFARQVYDLVKGDYLRMCSIGFIPGDMSEPSDEDMKALPDIDWSDVDRVIRTGTLLECSIVTIGSNPESMVSAIKSGDIEVHDKGIFVAMGCALEDEDDSDAADGKDAAPAESDDTPPEEKKDPEPEEKTPAPTTKPGWDTPADGDYIHFQIHDPKDFPSLATKTVQEDPEIKGRYGRASGEPRGKFQSLLFPKARWTVSGAKEWVSEHAEIAERSLGEGAEHAGGVENIVHTTVDGKQATRSTPPANATNDGDGEQPETPEIPEANLPSPLDGSKYITRAEAERREIEALRTALAEGERCGLQKAEDILAEITGDPGFSLEDTEDKTPTEIRLERLLA